MSDFAIDHGEHSPQMQWVSDRPRLLRDIVVVTLDDGVLIDGLGRQEVIRGPLAETVLPDLLNLLDGNHTLRDLQDAFPAIPKDYIGTAISMLMDWGMIEHAADQSDQIPTNPATMAFLRRCVATYGLGSSADSAYKYLRDTPILIVANEEDKSHGNDLRLQLRATGVDLVSVLTKDEFYTVTFPANSLAISLNTKGEDIEWYTELDRRKTESSFSWLRAVIEGSANYIDIGPLFKPGADTCYSCFRDVHIPSADGRSGLPWTLYDERIWTSFIALEVTHILAFPTLTLSGRQFRRLHLRDWNSRLFSYPRLPGCNVCRKQPLRFVDHQNQEAIGNKHNTDTALVFEEYVALEARPTLSSSAKSDLEHVSSALVKEAKRLPVCEQIPLYRGDLRLGVGGLHTTRDNKQSEQRACTLDQLAALLAITAGVREISENGVKRWAATAGNLGSVELYIANRSIEGLERGFYFYQAQEHTVAPIRKRTSLGVFEFMGRVLGRVENDLPDALVLFTGAFHRLSRKYSSFGYRLMNLDAGAALSQMNLIARSMSICARTVPSLADDLIQELFNLIPFDEHPTAVVEISRTARNKNSTLIGKHLTTPPSPHSWKAAHEFRALDVQEVTAMLMRESLMSEGAPRFGGGEIPQDFIARDNRRPLVVRLSKPERRGLSVGEIFAKRTSVREYSQRFVRTGDIGTALHYAHSNDISDIEELHDGPCCYVPLTFFVLAKGAQETDHRVYEYDAARHGLVSAGPSLSREQVRELFVQSEFVDAPVFIWITGNLAEACARDGARGHRQLLLRAGAAGHRLWMAALGLGLSGSLVAGLVPGAARRLLNIDGLRFASLFAFAAGYQAQESKLHANPKRTRLRVR